MTLHLKITPDGKLTGETGFNGGFPPEKLYGELYLDYLYIRVEGRDTMIIGDISSPKN